MLLVAWFSLAGELSCKCFVVGCGLLLTFCLVCSNWNTKLKAMLQIFFFCLEKQKAQQKKKQI
jgi:hypothetical protein